MSLKKTHEEYELELCEKDIQVWPIEPYDGAQVHIKHECINGHIWKVRPTDVLRGIGCAECYGNERKSLEKYNEQLSSRGITALSYVSHREYANHKCNICEHGWKAKPRDILADHGCPSCANKNRPGGYNKTRFDRDRDLANTPGVLYIVVLVNKTTNERACVKIGITKGNSFKDVIKRSTGFKGYDLRTQKIVQGTLEYVFNLEQNLHKRWAGHKYTKSHRFGGHTELFEIGKLPEILKSVQDYV